MRDCSSSTELHYIHLFIANCSDERRHPSDPSASPPNNFRGDDFAGSAAQLCGNAELQHGFDALLHNHYDWPAAWILVLTLASMMGLTLEGPELASEGPQRGGMRLRGL